MVAIIDYGVGNLFSLKSSFASIGEDAIVTDDPEKLRSADRLILPGVGAFGDAAGKLRESGLDKVLLEEVDKSQTTVAAVFKAAFKEHLHTETNAHKRFAFFYLFKQNFIKAALAELCRRVAERSHTRENESVGRSQFFGVVGNDGIIADSCKGAFEGKEISHAVINDRNH